MASPRALVTSWDGDVSLIAKALWGTGRSMAFLDHMLLVLLGELHGLLLMCDFFEKREVPEFHRIHNLEVYVP